MGNTLIISYNFQENGTSQFDTGVPILIEGLLTLQILDFQARKIIFLPFPELYPKTNDRNKL